MTAASVAMEQLTEPPAPTEGVAHVSAGPAVCVADTKVVPAGNGSDRLTVCAALGPALATFIV